MNKWVSQVKSENNTFPISKFLFVQFVIHSGVVLHDVTFLLVTVQRVLRLPKVKVYLEVTKKVEALIKTFKSILKEQ